jgi:superfamily II DNA or RNA helicase
VTLFDLVDAGPSGPASVTLRPYQQAIIEAIAASPSQRQLVQAATGVGKTVMFASLPQWPSIRARLGASPWAMLVIAHREELIDQAASKIAGQNPGLTVAVEQGDRYASVSSDVVVASVQTLVARQGGRLRRLMREKPFRLVIVDEAHHASATTYRAVLTTLGFLPPDLPITDASELSSALKAWDSSHGHEPRLLVGVTATPNRSDGVGLAAVFQSMVYTYPIRQAISDGWLVEIVAWAIETRESIDHVKTTAGEFNQKQLAEAVNTEARNRLAVTSWQQHAQGRQTIAFTVDVAHAHAAADTFTASGIPAMAVSGDTPKDDRRAILESYRNRPASCI